MWLQHLALLNMKINSAFPWKAGGFLEQLSDSQLLKKSYTPQSSRVLQNWVVTVYLDSTASGQNPVALSYEPGNETRVPYEAWIAWLAENCQLANRILLREVR
jgi:hypothetical protein